MNTQLKERPATNAIPETHFSRPPSAGTGKKGSFEVPAPSPAPSRRWIAVLAAVLLAAGAALAISAITSESATSTEPVQRPAFDSPGGNSLNVPVVEAGVIAPSGFDGPGGNSLNVPVVEAPVGATSVEPVQRPAFDSPGGNSLNVPVVEAGVIAPSGFDGPGGNSLNVPVVGSSVSVAPAGFESPGGNSLNLD